jgi:hypothetical protein
MRRGVVFRGKVHKPELAPESFRDPVGRGDDALDVRPTGITSSAREAAAGAGAGTPFVVPQMFSPAVRAPAARAPLGARAPVGARPPAGARPQQTPVLEKEVSKAEEALPPPSPAAPAAAAAAAPEEVEAEAEVAAATEKPRRKFKTCKDSYTRKTLKNFCNLITDETWRNPYMDKPAAYIPETRRGFSNFINTTYSSFMLNALSEKAPPLIDNKYPYQRFIREYMRNDSPYRGILVYHGLGSGKTCTAIATSEALFSTSRKKIIVMTPASLRKNYLNEVSFCGFHHFRLKNFWVTLELNVDEHMLFAQQVMNIPASYLKKVTRIWIPDFRKEESNYDSLDSAYQTEIRKQILATLVWDPEKNPDGQIRFIHYNGFTSKRLKDIACNDPTFFDDAVIIIDEVHNLIRLMQGAIDPYLIKPATKPAPKEKVGIGKWKISAADCNNSEAKFSRAYSFYRLLLGAVNSKIVGLSGTPLINFPEELGILMNLLHGYIPVFKPKIREQDGDSEMLLKNLLYGNLYTDYVSVSASPTGGIQATVTFLPLGVRKILREGVDPTNPELFEGVERFPPDEVAPLYEDIIRDLKSQIQEAGLTILEAAGAGAGAGASDPSVEAIPLLPIDRETFEEKFIDFANIDLKNDTVLKKRITGLISYYSGSNKNLMPQVKMDVIVKVPFSKFQKLKYSEVRTIELNSKKKKTSVEDMVDDAMNVGDSSVYRMSSRQMCNFAFPNDVVRPRPQNKKELEEEENEVTVPLVYSDAADMGEGFVEEDAEEEFAAEELVDDAEELEEVAVGGGKTLAEIIAEAKAKKAAAAAPVPAAPVPAAAPRKQNSESNHASGLELRNLVGQRVSAPIHARKSIAEIAAAARAKKAANAAALAAPLPFADLLQEESPKRRARPAPLAAEDLGEAAPAAPATARAAAASALTSADCKIYRKPDEKYRDAITRVKTCLETFASKHFMRGVPDGLEVYSPKFAAILDRIEALPGSSLVYSQFVDLEGIGIFRIAMNVNGYAPIEIEGSPTGLKFKDTTIASLAKGPGGQLRYCIFSGKEDDMVRRTLLDVFNAKINILPENLQTVLREYGYTDNMQGQLARVFCISSAGAEGISLENVRGVHIMEPYWNDVRTKQVKGRAIRIGSHLKLPVAQRDVSIYTYIATFGDESQMAKTEEGRIVEKISTNDSLSREEAEKVNIAIPEGLMQYVMTSDEYLYYISQIKKKIIDKLEMAMKTAAVDCKLNVKQNRGEMGTSCFYIKGGLIGDFMYKPDLDEDIIDTASRFATKAAEPAAAAAAAAAPRLVKKLTLKSGKVFRAIKEPDSDIFDLYDFEGDDTVIVGSAGVSQDGKPIKPITIF